MSRSAIEQLEELEDRVPAHALGAGVDLFVIRHDESVEVFYGRRDNQDALPGDLTTCKTDIGRLAGVAYGGVAPVYRES